jgi:hypothetical protein
MRVVTRGVKGGSRAVILVGRPPLSVGTYGSISIAPYDTGYRARTRYRDYDGVTRRVERHGRTKGAAERVLRLALRHRLHVGAEAEIHLTLRSLGLRRPGSPKSRRRTAPQGPSARIETGSTVR